MAGGTMVTSMTACSSARIAWRMRCTLIVPKPPVQAALCWPDIVDDRGLAPSKSIEPLHHHASDANTGENTGEQLVVRRWGQGP